MRILLLGKDGQVGWELQRALAPLGELIAWGRAEADLEQPEALAAPLRTVAPQVIVNAAAYTAVDQAESEPARARRINTEAVAWLAEAAARLGAWFVHYSTDYVFDGTKPSPYTEDDETRPLNVYGLSKRDGEAAIRASGCRHLVFRTSWVYAAHGNNFLKTILRLAQERDELQVVADQRGAPTGAALIADVTALCLYRLANDPALAERADGIYHLAAAGETTWHAYAQWLVAEAWRLGVKLRLSPERIVPISAADYPAAAARRPANSLLDTRKLRQTFGLSLPHWQEGVKRVLREWKR
jgi:dTDP-4-dehydrorhamnose reductase